MLDLHRKVAAIVLKATSGHKVALAGGNALLVHGVGNRPTHDVDVFVDELDAVPELAAAMVRALARDGYTVEDTGRMNPVIALWGAEAGNDLAEYMVTLPGHGGGKVQLQVARFTLRCPVVQVPRIGPVVALDDAAGHKACAVVGRMEPRDYVDIAALCEAGYTGEELITLAMQRDEGLELAEFADAARWLDRQPDSVLAPFLPAGRDAAWVRKAFADWPRDNRRD
jgi:hypothetical protein